MEARRRPVSIQVIIRNTANFPSTASDSEVQADPPRADCFQELLGLKQCAAVERTLERFVWKEAGICC